MREICPKTNNRMSICDWMKGNVKYLHSLTHRNPMLSKEGYPLRADLHAHPYINDSDSLGHTLKVLARNNVAILGAIVHGTGNNSEKDFWEMKSLFGSLSRKYSVEDFGGVIKVFKDDRTFVLTGGYEDYCEIDEVKGRLDLVIISPQKGIEKYFPEENKFAEKVKIARDYGGLIIAAHPYALWDPYGPKGFFKFRLASPREREVIREVVFPQVDSVDLVATNVSWMVNSNELAKKDYRLKALCTSDTHSISKKIRELIGTSGCLFPAFDFTNDDEFRAKMSYFIRKGIFQPYLNYLGPINFLKSIAFSRPSDSLP